MYNDLVLFIKIVNVGSFAHASKLTCIGASTITRKIQQLEDKLGYILLKRDTRSIELSNAGKELYDKLSHLEVDVATVLANLEKGRDTLSGQLSILLPPCFALKIITPYLVDYLIKYPKIILNITNESRATNLIKDQSNHPKK